jgi:hypothetical protein
MLTDIFANRYDGVTVRRDFLARDEALMVQMFALLREDVAPRDGVPEQEVLDFWAALKKRLSREFGVPSLSDRVTLAGRRLPASQSCCDWMFMKPGALEPADSYIKKRLSLIELGFRLREEALAEKGRRLPAASDASIARLRGPTATTDAAKIAAFMVADIDRASANFRAAVEELNARLRQAGYPLHYHNGLLQFSEDKAIEAHVEAPFWKLVAAAKWANVDHDMKEAIDLRDTMRRDPAWYAARALESTIKIISAEKGWTTGNEKGAHNHIDNLVSKGNGRFIEVWEADQLKGFFTAVRNQFGHGPGPAAMPSLTPPQTDWVIALSMAWIRSLIVRM